MKKKSFSSGATQKKTNEKMELINLDTTVNMSEKNVSEKDETEISINVKNEIKTDQENDIQDDVQARVSPKEKLLQGLMKSVNTFQSFKNTINKCNNSIRNIIIAIVIIGILYTTADNNISQKKLMELINNTTATLSR